MRDPVFEKVASGFGCSYERAQLLYRVLERATDLALDGAGKFGAVVERAASECQTPLTERERGHMVLSCARATMALRDDQRRNAS